MSLVDAAMTRDVLRDIGKHPVEISELQVHVQHGVVYLSGRLGKVRGYQYSMDMHEELNMIVRILRQKQGIRDVICEVEVAQASLEERVSRRTKQPPHR